MPDLTPETIAELERLLAEAPIGVRYQTARQRKADVALSVAAVNALPALLAERERLREALREAAGALKAWIATALTLRAHLEDPYPDDPRWTPYTRFVERELRRTAAARAAIRAALEGTPDD